MDNEEQKYDLFISYYSGTGIDFAKFLKRKLVDFGINAFLDVEDIPKSIKHDTDEWRTYIDRAILGRKKFVLLMTLGFNTRNEIMREIKIAKDNRIERIHFKHTSLSGTDFLVKIDNKEVDFSKYQYTEFDDEPDLLRKLGAELLGRPKNNIKKSIFMETALEIINNEGNEARPKNIPFIEIVVGSSNEQVEWFHRNIENRNIILSSPFRLTCVTPRKKFFECEADNLFFRVHTKGVFHLIAPLSSDNQEKLFYIDDIIFIILEALVYSIKVMKFNQIKTNYSSYIILKNIRNIELSFGRFSRHNVYHFAPETNEVKMIHQFNPSDLWSDIKETFFNIYRDLIDELGILDISEKEVGKRIFDLLNCNNDVHREYQLVNKVVPRIEMKEFGFPDR